MHALHEVAPQLAMLVLATQVGPQTCAPIAQTHAPLWQVCPVMLQSAVVQQLFIEMQRPAHSFWPDWQMHMPALHTEPTIAPQSELVQHRLLSMHALPQISFPAGQ